MVDTKWLYIIDVYTGDTLEYKCKANISVEEVHNIIKFEGFDVNTCIHILLHNKIKNIRNINDFNYESLMK